MLAETNRASSRMSLDALGIAHLANTTTDGSRSSDTPEGFLRLIRSFRDGWVLHRDARELFATASRTNTGTPESALRLSKG